MPEPLWTSDQITAATNGVACGRPFAADGLSIDTRTLTPGDLFVALNGARDGHDFLPQAYAAGAAGALVSRAVQNSPSVRVNDTLAGLERLAVAARERSGARRAAVTGSVGKTSVTQAMAAALRRAGPSHAPVKSFNNHIGVPLTLAALPPEAAYAVFELGMNHAGEIGALSRLVAPHVAVVTTVGPVHVENFPDGEVGVARAKAEIFEGMAPGGVAVLNADDAWFDLLSTTARSRGAQVLSFGAGPRCDARLGGYSPKDGGGVVVEATLLGKTLRFPIAQSGAHWASNSLAVLLAVGALGAPAVCALETLADFTPLAGRGAQRRIPVAGGEATLVDESYNANPVSMRAALAALTAAPPRRIAVLTDMLELGRDAEHHHLALAKDLDAAEVDLVFLAGPLMRRLWDVLPAARRGAWAPGAAELAPDVAAAVRNGDTVMVKGSNGSKASLIVQALADGPARTPASGRSAAPMIYLIYQSLDAHHHYVPVLNLLRYLTFRTGLAFITGYVVAVAMGSRFIRWMRTRQGKGQPIRSDGIERHILEKKGTPTMGGFMILAGLMVGTLLWADLHNVYVWVVLMVTAAYGALGFIDDYEKVTKQTVAGVSSRMKLLVQFLIAAIAVALIIQFGQKMPEPAVRTAVAFPIFKDALLKLGWFYIVFGMVFIAGFSNAVNLTDGLDGLAIVPVMIAAAAFGFIAYLVGNLKFADYLQVHPIPGAGELAIICGALMGAGLGFLWYNAPPAKIFMGDTGSLALGGALGTMAVVAKHEIVLVIIGGLFVAETLSVMIQVGYFKRTGRRVFLMAPIHHHFEKLGWAESTVVIRFWIVSILLALVGLATLKLR